MRTLYLLGALAVGAYAAAAATTTTTTSSTTKSCQPTVTTTAKFGKQTQGATPSAGLAQASWSGWTVANLSNYDLTSKGSGPLGIVASSYYGTQIKWAPTSPSYGYVGILKGFDFACVYELLDFDVYAPQGCDIIMTTPGLDSHYPVNGYGPYNFEPNSAAIQNGKPSNMTRVTVGGGGSAGANWIFNLFSADSTSGYLILDNVVFEYLDLDCEYY